MMKLMSMAAAMMLAVSGQGWAEQPAGTPLFEVSAVDRDTVPPGTPEAFSAVFGQSLQNEAVRVVDEQNISFVPLSFIPLGGGRVALVSTGASECDGHSCSGVNSVHYLLREERYAPYKIEGEWLDVGTGGTFGNPAERWGWSDAIAEAPVLYTEGGGVWQGYACSTAALTELTPQGPVEIASIPIYYSSTGADEINGITLEGTIVSAEKGRSFTVAYSGARSFSERYVRGADGSYALSGEAQVPGC